MRAQLSSVHLRQGLSSDALKTIAIIAMLIDHIALLLPSDPYSSPLVGLMRFIGRITGPLMFFFIAEGYQHTRDVARYTKRLAVFALISYFPFVLFHNSGLPPSFSGWLKFNVIYTLLLGLLALRARHEVKNAAISVFLVGLCLVASVFGDWSYIGVMAILLFDLLYGSLTNQRIGFCLLALLFGVMPLVSDVMTGSVQGDLVTHHLITVGVRLGMLLPMLLLGQYNGQRGRGSTWFFTSSILPICYSCILLQNGWVYGNIVIMIFIAYLNPENKQ